MLSDSCSSSHFSDLHTHEISCENLVFAVHATATAHACGASGRDPRDGVGVGAGAGGGVRLRTSTTRAYATAVSITTALTDALPDAQLSVMPPQKRSGSELYGTPAKFPRTEQPEEFSNAVKKRLQSSNRTGQACDRCKVRKIRCDGLPGGCSPCLQNSTECRTTDRITGRATSRGYVEGLEQQNANFQQRIQELEQRLIQNGVDIKPSNGYHDATIQNYDYTASSREGQAQLWIPSHSSYPSTNVSTALTAQHEETKALPAFRAGCSGDNYLGVSAGNPHLSSIKGTALSILGMEIDITDFESSDIDEPDPSIFHPHLYNKSYQSFLQSALNINPRIEKLDLPPRQEGFTYVQWFFRVISPYMPLLHKPTFMKLLTRMYDDPSFRPTTAETVMVHMIFAIMFFQYASRNWEDAAQQARLNHLSNMHYHYCLGTFYTLLSSHTFQDVQALTLICAHLRNLPKPGASWMMTQITLSLAVELGLHRSAKRWASENIPNPLEVEMRKRTFWSLLIIDVTLSGKLGRPMTFRNEDLDVELPEPVDDELLSESGLDTSKPGKCLHLVGLAAYRILPLFLELYSTIYAVRRRPEAYIPQVNRLEGLLRDWKEGLPAELVKGGAGPSDQEGRVFALYAQVWPLEFRLLLRHPAVSLTSDASFNAASMRICVESARQMLAVVRQLQKFKSLDTTWYNCTVYVMAITTTLFDQWDRRGETSGADLAALKEEMDMWLDVMGDVGALLGSGTHLRDAVKVVTDGTLGLLARSLPSKKVSYLTQTSLSQEDVKPEPDNDNTLQPGSNSARNSFNNNFSYAPPGPQPNGNSTTSTYLPPDGHLTHTHQSTPYPAVTEYPTYPDSSANPLSTFIDFPSSTESVEAPLHMASFSQSSQLPYTYPTSTRPQSSSIQSGSQAWQQWTSTVAGNLEHLNNYSNPVLVQLSGRSGNVPPNRGLPEMGTSQASSSMVDLRSSQAIVGVNTHVGNMGIGHPRGPDAGGMNMSWPLNIFDS